MEWWEHLEHAWEWLVEKTTLFLAYLFGFDPLIVLPWAQLLAAVLAVIASTWGLYNLWNHFDIRRRKLLTAFLDSEEKKILDRKNEIAQRFLQPRKNKERLEVLDVDANLEVALKLYDAGKLKKADRVLRGLLEAIDDRRAVASRQAEVAVKQVGAVHLFLGAMQAARGNPHGAIDSFQDALQHNRDDLDALKYVAEQHFLLALNNELTRSTHLDNALEPTNRLIEKVGDDNVRKAEALCLKGEIFAYRGNPLSAKPILSESAQHAEMARDQQLIAMTNEKFGMLCARLKHWQDAESAFYSSIAAFRVRGTQSDIDRVTNALKCAKARQPNADDPWFKHHSGSARAPQSQVPVAVPPLKDPTQSE